jgi:hypothetical protein
VGDVDEWNIEGIGDRKWVIESEWKGQRRSGENSGARMGWVRIGFDRFGNLFVVARVVLGQINDRSHFPRE